MQPAKRSITMELQLQQLRGQRSIILFILAMISAVNANGDWMFNDEQAAGAQYAKLFGQVTGDANNNNNPTQEQFGPFQYQYVDYQPNCKPGGEPVCATNGVKFFRFENICKLEAENMKMLFQYGTELEPTELTRCMPDCENIKCTTKYAPICAAPETGPHQGQGVTFANECEVRRRECVSKETQRFLNRGPCHQLKSKSKSKSKRKYRRRSTTMAPTESSTATVTTTSQLPRTEAPRTTTTTSTTTPVPMQFHEYRSHVNPGVSVARAVNAYSVYNIPDVGEDYNEITDSSLSVYLPGVGTVTDTPPSTTTTTTTTTPKPTTSTTTGLPYTSSTVDTTLAPPTTTTAKTTYSFFFVPYGTTSTTTEQSSSSADSTTEKVENNPIIKATSKVVVNPTSKAVESTTSKPANSSTGKAAAKASIKPTNKAVKSLSSSTENNSTTEEAVNSRTPKPSHNTKATVEINTKSANATESALKVVNKNGTSTAKPIANPKPIPKPALQKTEK